MALSKIQAESVDLTDNFAFTGSVSGAGKLVRMGVVRLTTYFGSGVLNTWTTAQTFSITGVTSGNTIYINLSLNDVLEQGNYQYWRLLNNNSTNIGQWGRHTDGNGSWRQIRADATMHDYDTAGGTRNYTIQSQHTAGYAYINYPSGDTDMASYITWWEIA